MPGKKLQPAVIPVQCTDKTFDTTPPQDHPCSMPRGSRIAVVSDPGRGKSSLIKNMACRSAPWAAVYVIHGMAESKEYDLIDHTKLTMDQATPEFWASESKKHGKAPLALIIDDYDYSSMSKTEKTNCYKLCQHACTHHNVTAWLVSHSLTQLVPRIRRTCDVMCIWPPTTGGADQTPYLARSLGIERALLQEAFDECLERGKYSFLCIYQDPPKGRSRIMIDCAESFE